MRLSLDDFLGSEEIDRVAGRDGLSRRLPRKVYSDPDFLALEYRGWLDRTWLVVGRAHEMPNTGDTALVPGHPIFLVRGKDRIIRAFYNSCRHRGHEVVREACNTGNTIVCPYHHWTYELSGELRAAMHFSGYRKHKHPDLDPVRFGLRSIRCEVWHNWVLINIDGNAPPIEEFVAPMAQFYSDVDFSQAEHFATVKRHPLNANG